MPFSQVQRRRRRHGIEATATEARPRPDPKERVQRGEVREAAGFAATVQRAMGSQSVVSRRSEAPGIDTTVSAFFCYFFVLRCCDGCCIGYRSSFQIYVGVRVHKCACKLLDDLPVCNELSRFSTSLTSISISILLISFHHVKANFHDEHDAARFYDEHASRYPGLRINRPPAGPAPPRPPWPRPPQPPPLPQVRA